MKFIVVGGSPATGKTTVATRLSERTGIRRVSMDEVKEALFDVGGYRDRGWSQEIGRIAWPAFQQLVELHARQGHSVIAEATFLWPGDVEWITSVAEKNRAELSVIWLTADPAIARERFVKRATSGERHPGHNDALEEVMAEFDTRFFQQRFDAPAITSRQLVLDTTEINKIDHEAILSFIQSPTPSP